MRQSLRRRRAENSAIRQPARDQTRRVGGRSLSPERSYPQPQAEGRAGRSSLFRGFGLVDSIVQVPSFGERMALERRKSRSSRSPTLKPSRQNPRKPAVHGANREREMRGGETDWSSGENRDPTFSGQDPMAERVRLVQSVSMRTASGAPPSLPWLRTSAFFRARSPVSFGRLVQIRAR